MIDCSIDVHYENIIFSGFTDLNETLNYVNRIKDVINRIRGEFRIHWGGEEEEGDLLSAIMVSFRWYFIDENSYEIHIELDDRVCEEIGPKLVERLKEFIPAKYRKYTEEEKEKALRLMYPEEYHKRDIEEMEEEFSEELTSWADENFNLKYVSPSIYVKLDDDGKPEKLNIELICKTGDGSIEPYYETPPDDKVIKLFKHLRWGLSANGLMEYEKLTICPKCGYTKLDECVKIGRNKYRHIKCGTEFKDKEVIGYKWIIGESEVYLDGNENKDDIKNIISKILRDVIKVMKDVESGKIK